MDITINPVSGTSQPLTPATSKVRESFVPVSAPQADAAAVPAVTLPQSSPSASGGDPYEAAIQQIAQSYKNVYAVSDQDFTIFKDATGKYITRYVSLRDGKVTYVPTPTLVKQLPLSDPSTSSVAISA